MQNIIKQMELEKIQKESKIAKMRWKCTSSLFQESLLSPLSLLTLRGESYKDAK